MNYVTLRMYQEVDLNVYTHFQHLVQHTCITEATNPSAPDILLAQGGMIFFAGYDGSAVGMVSVKLESPTVFEIPMHFVTENCRGRGFGRLLLLAAIEYVREVHGKRIRLNVCRGNTIALRLYGQLGFGVFPLDHSNPPSCIRLELVLK